MTRAWTRATADDPLDGLRDLLAAADCGYEPRDGYEDHCWLLTPLHDDTGARHRWHDVLARAGHRLADRPGTFSYLTFEGVEGADALDGVHGGEIDRATLTALVPHLARHSAAGEDTPCGAAQAPVTAAPGVPLTDDPGTRPVRTRPEPGPLAWRGRLADAPAHHDAVPLFSFPATWWAADGSWLVLTDIDLSATEVFGSRALIADLLADPELEAVRAPTLAETLGR
ncbi:hypothetical protein ACFVU3_37100 [Streptomyces sp. NPDC058052]|uniref:hypothetical protein n=1 Tax=Streptomyces sp. NPDC058052 TaxID=3346316 RepID=UPI0036E72889